MHVTHLSLADFRSYARVEVPLDPGVTAFVGPNGQGKTNLVEAVGYLATLGSHRVSSDAPWSAWAPTVRSSAPRSSRASGSSWSSWSSTPARPTVPVSTGPRRSGRVMCLASCGPCCSRPRTWPWSRATPVSAVASSTS